MIRPGYSETLEVYEKERADDMEALLAAGRAIGDDFRSMSGQRDYFSLYEKEGYIFTPFVSTIKNASVSDVELVNVECRQAPVFNGRMDVLKGELSRYVRQGYDTTIVCSSDETYREHDGISRA